MWICPWDYVMYLNTICHLCLMAKYYTEYCPSTTTIWKQKIMPLSSQAFWMNRLYSSEQSPATLTSLSSNLCVFISARSLDSVQIHLLSFRKLSWYHCNLYSVVSFLLRITVWHCYCSMSKKKKKKKPCHSFWCFLLFMIRELDFLLFLLGWG